LATYCERDLGLGSVVVSFLRDWDRVWLAVARVSGSRTVDVPRGRSQWLRHANVVVESLAFFVAGLVVGWVASWVGKNQIPDLVLASLFLTYMVVQSLYSGVGSAASLV
jgi:hypothetical protein